MTVDALPVLLYDPTTGWATVRRMEVEIRTPVFLLRRVGIGLVVLLAAACTSAVDEAAPVPAGPETTVAAEQPGTTAGTTDTTQAASPGGVDFNTVTECIEAAGYDQEALVYTPGTKIRTFEEANEEMEYLGLSPMSGPPPGGHFERIVDIDEYNRWRRTEAACVEVTGGQPARDPVAEAAYTEVALAVDECMRSLGWEFPDPWANPWGTGYVQIMLGPEMVPTDQEEREAFMDDHRDCTRPVFEKHLRPLFDAQDAED
jgi:hypothetical protein